MIDVDGLPISQPRNSKKWKTSNVKGFTITTITKTTYSDALAWDGCLCVSLIDKLTFNQLFLKNKF